MTENPIQVLLVEDNPGDARLIREHLVDAGPPGFTIETVNTLAHAVARCSRPGIDAILLDLGLPDSIGLHTLKAMQACTPDLPVVVLSGLDDEKIAAQAVLTGAQDYLIKGKTDGTLTARALRYAIERKRAEENLLKIQKLQSVGTLAAGIAHDFNNILLGLFGYISLAKDELPKDHAGYTLLEEAEKVMTRALRLTKQLLAFAKDGITVKDNISLGALVEEVVRFDLSGSKVSLVYQQAHDLWLAEADKGQIQQVVSNLAINARQAMPEGGHLFITLENAVINEMAIPGLRHGKYVKVTVRDEGAGIDEKNLARIFDPYFTTRPNGSGLGLATAFSVINKHGGHIGVVSERDKGTTFTFYLPASESLQLAKT